MNSASVIPKVYSVYQCYKVSKSLAVVWRYEIRRSVHFCRAEVTHQVSVVFFNYVQWNLQTRDTLGQQFCPLYRGCPYLGG